MFTPGFQKCSSPTGCSAAHGDVSSSAVKIMLILLFASSGAVVFLYFANFVSRLVLRVLRSYLAKASIDAISPTEFKASVDGVFVDGASGVDCVVCLLEIRDGELVRVLPKCRHVFHVPCIDPWLKCHTNCPVCRANIAGDGVNDVDLERGAPAVSPAPAGAGVSISTVPAHNMQPFEEEQRRVGLMENGV